MIKTNELMLGNWVEYEVYPNERAGRKYVVGIIDNNNVYLSTDEDKGKYPDLVKKENLFGIPITEELLEKCGFRKGAYDWYGPNEIEVDLEKSAVLMGFMRDEEWKIKGIHFLHELQNAYFMLTKKHLEVKL